MDKDRRNSRRALAGNAVFVLMAALILVALKALWPATPTWVLAVLFFLSCLGLLGDLINILRRRRDRQ